MTYLQFVDRSVSILIYSIRTMKSNSIFHDIIQDACMLLLICIIYSIVYMHICIIWFGIPDKETHEDLPFNAFTTMSRPDN